MTVTRGPTFQREGTARPLNQFQERTIVRPAPVPRRQLRACEGWNEKGVDKEDKNVREEKRRTFDRSQSGRDRPTGFPEVYGLGRNRSPLCHAGGRPEVVQPKQNVGVGTQGRGRTELRPNQRQSHGI